MFPTYYDVTAIRIVSLVTAALELKLDSRTLNLPLVAHFLVCRAVGEICSQSLNRRKAKFFAHHAEQEADNPLFGGRLISQITKAKRQANYFTLLFLIGRCSLSSGC